MNGNSIRKGLAVGNEGSKTDWNRVIALTDADIDAAIDSDADAYAIAGPQLGHSGSEYQYRIVRQKSGGWRWILVARDGAVLATSATALTSREAAQAAIAGLRQTLLGASIAA
jgi:uncharacterized protein YegP (UPF0339 family)